METSSKFIALRSSFPLLDDAALSLFSIMFAHLFSSCKLVVAGLGKTRQCHSLLCFNIQGDLPSFDTQDYLNLFVKDMIVMVVHAKV